MKAITGRRLILNAIARYDHSGKIDYDQNCRRRSRRSWRNDARRVKGRVNRLLDIELRNELAEAFAA